MSLQRGAPAAQEATPLWEGQSPRGVGAQLPARPRAETHAPEPLLSVEVKGNLSGLIIRIIGFHPSSLFCPQTTLQLEPDGNPSWK